MGSLGKIAEIIKDKDHYILLGHIDPDGDSIGSLFALKWALDILKKKSLILLHDDITDKYDFLKIKKNDYTLYNNFDVDILNWPEMNIIALDSGDRDRLGDSRGFTNGKYIINIDHHIDNKEYGNINYINEKMAAVGEIIYDLLNYLDIPINKDIGTAIGLAIITDTGGFRYQNTSAKTFRIFSSLVESDIDIYQLNKNIFGKDSYEAVKLKGLVLETLRLSSDRKIAWLEVEQSALEKAGADIKDATGMVNYARDIKGVEVGIAFFEMVDGRTKVSFRSNYYCSVNEIAAHFGGGGHDRAAGCTIDENIKQAKKMVLKKVKEYV